MQFVIAAFVLQFGEPAQQFALIDVLAAHDVQHHAVIFARIAESIDRRHGRNDDRIAALDQRLRRRKTHLLDVFVDRRIFVDVRVARRNVRLGLVVIVIADEIFHRVVRKEFLEFAVQLRGQRLVRREHQRRFLHRFDDVGDGERLARTGHAQQRLMRETRLKTVDQFLDRVRLIAGRLKGRNELETVGHQALRNSRKV